MTQSKTASEIANDKELLQKLSNADAYLIGFTEALEKMQSEWQHIKEARNNLN